MSITAISTAMNATKEPTPPRVVPKRILKGKDGCEPFADKIADNKAFIERVGLPEEFKSRKSFATKKE
ncbi:hypothetical protein GCM10028809_21750 [Spirosoma gilvum]